MSPDSLDVEAMALLSQALDQPSGEREAWVRRRCGDNDRLASRVLALLDADRHHVGLLRTGGAGEDAAEDEHPRRVGAYEITGLIGQGGMGAVYEGRRDSDDFEHRVAIKVVKPGAMSDTLIERFQRERRILASLNHPHIARLFDGGQTDDGAPFIVMEYVDGQPITDWADTLGLSIDDRLWLFSDLCGAVRHAHQNLIVHRDITPSNVLVTHEGVVKLIDFGIAKPQSVDDRKPGADERRASGLSYTPGYAAPERASGAGANTLSDIYSLGRILETLLRGQRRDGDLDAIIARATAHVPQDRYASVDALIDDLRAYRSGYAVAARSGGALYRVGKYLGRYRIAAGLSALAVVALIGGLVLMTLLYQRAEANRLAADQRFKDVRALATFMMFDLYDEMEKVSGNTRSISMLADRAQTYLDSLSADPRASMDVKLEASTGYKRLADILGNPKNANLGRRQEAGEMLERALAEIEAVYARAPNEPAVMRALGETAFSLSTYLYVSTSQNQRAHDLAGRSAEMYARLTAAPEASFDDRRQLIRARLMSAVPLPWMGRHEEGIEVLRQAIGEAEALMAAYPDEPVAKQLLGSLNVELARALVRYGAVSDSAESSLPYWDEAVRLRQESYAQNPEDQRPYRSLVTIYYERGAAHRGNGNHEAAYADALRSEAIARELLAKDGDDAWLKRILSGIQDEKVKTLSYAGRHDEALAQAGTALALARRQYEAGPDDPGRKREWAYSLVLFADVHIRAGKMEQGCRLAGEARLVWNELAAIEALSEHDRNESIRQLDGLQAQCAA